MEDLVKDGRVIKRARKLWPVRSLLIQGQTCYDPERCAQKISTTFRQKWYEAPLADREDWQAFRKMSEGKSVGFTGQLVMEVMAYTKFRRVLDSNGVSGYVSATRGSFPLGADTLAERLEETLSDDLAMSAITVQ